MRLLSYRGTSLIRNTPLAPAPAHWQYAPGENGSTNTRFIRDEVPRDIIRVELSKHGLVRRGTCGARLPLPFSSNEQEWHPCYSRGTQLERNIPPAPLLIGKTPQVDEPSVETPIVRGLDNNCFAVMRSSSKEGSYLRLIDFCITQL